MTQERWLAVEQQPQIVGAQVGITQNAGKGAATEFAV